MVLVAKDDHIEINKLTLGPFGTNSYIMKCQAKGESVVVDAPGEPDEVLKHLEGSSPRYILITHTHMDHLGALSDLMSKLQVPVAVHPLEAESQAWRSPATVN